MARQDKSVEYITSLQELDYQFAYNVCTDVIEVNGTPLSDPLMAQIRRDLRDMGYTRMREAEDAYIAYAYQHGKYHPIKRYLNSLTWEGFGAIEALAGHFTDQHGMFHIFLRRWLIGAVAKAMAGGQNFMLVLDGPQDIGKSYFVRWLCPDSLSDRYFVEAPISADDKDTWIRLAGKWLWEVSELGATTRRQDREALKDFISRREVIVRKPYGRHDSQLSALASMIGTINEEGAGFLNDLTGSRRFAVVNLQAIDHAYTGIDIDQVWAEAFVAYQAGEQWRLTPTERETQDNINVEYQVESPVWAMFQRYYTIDPTAPDFVPAMNIITDLEEQGLRGHQTALLMDLARHMKKAGVPRKRIRNVSMYGGIVRRYGAVS